MLEKLISCVLSAGLYFPPDARGWAGLGWEKEYLSSYKWV